MALSKGKKRLFLIVASVVLATVILMAILWFVCPWIFTNFGVPQDMIRCGKYTGYDIVVVAPDTDDSVLSELDSLHINYVEYKKGRVLFGDGGLITESYIHKEPKIYLCAGEYDAELGNFISYSGKYPITICGDGSNKTVILGGSKLYSNNGTAIEIKGKKNNTLNNSLIQDISVNAFGFGINLKYADSTVIKNVIIKENHNCGLTFENTDNCKVSECSFEKNGNPETSDIGYGISFLYNSRDNEIKAEYKNNANNNAIDFPERYNKDLPDNNLLKLNKTYNLKDESIPIRDIKEEAQNAKPTVNSKRFEIEKAKIDNTGAVLSTSTENVKQFSGSGWVFLFNTKISLDINVEESGNYRIFVVGTSDDGNNKCDYFQVNGGTKYLTSFLGKQKGEWQICQPGEEYWENDELHPAVLTNGFELKAGKNTIDITANWGYCAYDAVIIEKIG